jgi:serine protease Do
MSSAFKWCLTIVAIAFALSLAACTPKDMQGASVRIVIPGGHGSGSHIGSRLILTAAHVVDGQTSLEIETHDGKKMPAKVLWVSKAFDVAVITYEGELLPSAQIACAPLKQGDAVTVYGNPGEVRFAKFNGFVSTAAGERAIWKVAHVLDVTGMPGVSGGGVFSMSGKLVGILVGGLATPFAPVSGITIMVPASEICKMFGRSS